ERTAGRARLSRALPPPCCPRTRPSTAISPTWIMPAVPQRRRSSARPATIRVCSRRAFGDTAMRILVTAGNTLVPIDRGRGITNIFTGRTGASIAVCAHGRGHDVTLCTSHPDDVNDLVTQGGGPWSERWRVVSFVTFDDLHHLLEDGIRRGGF